MNDDVAQAIRWPDGVDAERFLREFWQRKPLLMRDALPADAFPVDANELAGLACEDEVESRLLIGGGDIPWQTQHGPFDDEVFKNLPTSHWTLLVQDVDKFLPEVARLIDCFGFVPGWRIDDIMISYASDQGGVGPHTDAYDVFLMQAAGRRRWRLSYRDYDDGDLVPDIEQRILARFETDEDWVVQPGDILYLPPGVAHWGIAEGECMTYSLGFRAPDQRELAGEWFQHLVALAGDRRLMDPQTLASNNPAELTKDVASNVRRLLDTLPGNDSAEFDHWFGCHMTEPKPQFQLLPPEVIWSTTNLEHHLHQGLGLVRDPAARMAWSCGRDGSAVLYCQGDKHELPSHCRDAIKRLAETRWIDGATLQTLGDADPAVRNLLLELINNGVLEPEELA